MYANQSLSRTSKTSQTSHADLMKLMAEATAWFPNQRVDRLTQTLYLKAWREIADRHSYGRFEQALHAVLHRVDFFPLPRLIEEECEELRKQSWTPSAAMHIWECTRCGVRQGSQRAEVCMRCGGSPYDMDRLTPDPVTDVEMKRYHERIRSNPEEFVRVADIFREAHANVAARKLEKGRAA